jgi:molybdopterin-binding protein
MTLSARNRLEGKIVELQFGGVMAHVVVQVGKNLIESVITKKSADEMKLKVGDTVSAIIKSTEVMLEKSQGNAPSCQSRRPSGPSVGRYRPLVRVAHDCPDFTAF